MSTRRKVIQHIASEQTFTERQAPRERTQSEAAGATKPPLRFADGRLLIPVRVTPRAGRETLSLDADELRAHVAAPPVEGAANEALIALLARRLRVPTRAITITRGTSSRHKVIAVQGIEADEFWRRLGL